MSKERDYKEFSGGRASIDFWDKRSASYDRAVASVPIREEADDLLISVLPSAPEKVLDLGGGTGRLSRRISSLRPSATVVTFDISYGMLTSGPSGFGGAFLVQGGFTALPFAADSFDCVVSMFALHHVTDRDKLIAFKEIRRVLSPEGTLLIVDEVVSSTRLEIDDAEVTRMMYQVFYPTVPRQQLDDLFDSLVEWPTTTAALSQIIAAAGFVGTVSPLNSLVALVVAR